MKTKAVFGFHAVTSRIRHEPSSVEAVYVDAARADRRMQDMLKLAKDSGVRVIQADGQRLDRMVGTHRHQGVVAMAEPLSLARNLDELLDAIEGAPLLLVLDGITDPHNLGACFRVADSGGLMPSSHRKTVLLASTQQLRKSPAVQPRRCHTSPLPIWHVP